MRLLIVAFLLAISYAQTVLSKHSCGWQLLYRETYCTNRIVVSQGPKSVRDCGHLIRNDAQCNPDLLQLDHGTNRCKCIPHGQDCTKHSGSADIYQHVCPNDHHHGSHGSGSGGTPTFHPSVNHHTPPPPPTFNPTPSSPTNQPTTTHPTADPTVSHPTVSPTTSTPTVSPTTSFPSVSPTRKPSNIPTTSPFDIARIVFSGNYSEIIGANNSLFLEECSEQFEKIECISVVPGSIILQMTGPFDKLTQAKFTIASEGLWLPSFPALVIGSVQEDMAKDDESDLFDTWHILLMGIGFPVLCLLVTLLSYHGRKDPNKEHKHILLEDDFQHHQRDEEITLDTHRTYNSGFDKDEDYVDDLEIWSPSSPPGYKFDAT